MSEGYQIAETGDRLSSEQLARMLSREGQWLLPLVELVEQAECAVDEVIDVMGRATIEAVLQLSAEQVAGPRRQGKAEPTFADALATVRCLFWEQTVFTQPCLHGGVQKLPPPLCRMLVDIVCRAA